MDIEGQERIAAPRDIVWQALNDAETIRCVYDSLGLCFRAKMEQIPEIQGFHDLRVAPGDLRTRIIFDLVMKPGASFSEEEITEEMNRMVKQENPSYETIINFERPFL